MRFTPRRLLAKWFAGKFAAIAPASLRRWNMALGVLFALQGAAIVLLSAPYRVPVTVAFLTRDSLQSHLTGHTVTAMASEQLLAVDLAFLVAGFLFVAALAHLLAATVLRVRYEAALRKGVYAWRWIEYAAASAAMLAAIAILAGIHDLMTLILLAALAGAAPLCAWIMESQYPLAGRRTSPRWLAAIAGVLAGLMPWLAITASLAVTRSFGTAQAIPHFLYWACPIILALFAAFGINLCLLYAKRGGWSNYVYGERWYMVLSVTTKTYVAWQIFASVLRP